MKISLKKPVDVPQHVQAYIDAVLSSGDIAGALDGFVWAYDKGDFCHWVALFNHFEDFFEKHVQKRKSLQLNFDGSGAETTLEFPVADCLAILRVTAILLENTTNKHLYQSYDHLGALIASPLPEVVEAALKTLTSFVKKTHHASIRWHGNRDVTARLMNLCQGWGSDEEGLELTACVQEGAMQIVPKASALHFEFTPEEGVAEGAPRPVSIRLPAVDKLQEGELVILKQLVERYKVPEKLRFQLLTKIQIAKGCASLEGRRHLVRVRLMALWIIFQNSSSPDETQHLFQSEPELVPDLVTLVQTKRGVPEELRALAVRVLAVVTCDRSRAPQVVASLSSRGNGGVLSMLLHRAVASMVGQSIKGEGGAPAEVAAPAAAASSAAMEAAGSGDAMLAAAGHGDGGDAADAYSMDFVESMLSLVMAMVSSSQGCVALADAGVIGALLPMLTDREALHMGMVATTVKILESFMDYSQNASTMFRDLNGLHEMIVRLAHEAGVGLPPPLPAPPPVAPAAADAAVAAAAGEAAAADAATVSRLAVAVSVKGPEDPPLELSSLQATVAAKSPLPIVPLPYQRKVLMKFLMRAIAIGSYAPSTGNAATRPQEDDSTLLYGCLRAMFDQSAKFGGSLFALAASVVTDLIHHDPLIYRELDAAGLPQAFIDSVKAGVLPYGEAVASIANTLVALCLNVGGLEKVLQSRMMESLIPIFTSKKYHKALGSETPAIVGASIEELFRFVPQLRTDGVEAIVNIFRTICVIGGDEGEVEKAREQQTMMESAAAAAAAATAAGAEATDAGGAIQKAVSMETDVAEVAAAAPAVAAASVSAVGATEEGTSIAAAAGESATTDATSMILDRPADAPEGDSAAAAAAPAAAVAPAAAAAAPEVPKEPFYLGPALQELTSVEAQGYLPESINHSTRMLESLLSNVETSKEFVQKGGLDLLLKLHSLPRLSYTFAFSSTSHPLLAVFRGLAPHHAQVLSLKMRDVLAVQLDKAVEQVLAMGPSACVPELSEEVRAPYLKVVSTIAGLCSLGSSVARNATHMLQMISTGLLPVLAKMGQLQRLFMQQAAVADTWAMTREVARLVAEKTGPAAGLLASGAAGGAAAAADDGPSAGAATIELLPDAAAADMELVTGEVAGELEVAVVIDDVAAMPAAAASAAQIHAKPIKKKTPAEISHDIMHHSVSMLRGFFVAVAKSIHAPARRRDDPAMANPAQPGLGSRASALALAVLLKGSLKVNLPEEEPAASPALASPVVPAPPVDSPDDPVSWCAAASAMLVDIAADAAGPSSSSGPGQPAAGATATSAAAGMLPPSNSHLVRLAEEASALLFDSRRRSCHVLVFNFFVALGGLEVLLSRFSEATEQLWAAIQAQKVKQEAEAAAAAAASATTAAAAQASLTPDVAMAEASATATPAAAAVAEPGVAAAVVDLTASGSNRDREKEPRAVAERAVMSFLTLLEQLSNVNAICGSPLAPHLLVTPLPASAGPAAQAQIKDAAELLRHIQARVMTAALEVWAHPSLPSAGPSLTAALVTVLGHCAEGVGPAALGLLKAQGARTGAGEPGGRAAAAAMGFQPDPEMVQGIVEMGFSQAHVEEALRRIGANSIEAAMEWLITYPEPATAAVPAPAAAGGSQPAPTVVDDEEELSRALVAALGAIGSPAPGTTAAAPGAKAAAAPNDSNSKSRTAPGTAQLVEGAVSILGRMPSGVFSMADLMYTLATKDDARDRKVVLAALIDKLWLPFNSHLCPASSSSSATAEPRSPTKQSDELYIVSRLLLLLLTRDNASRELACSLGLASRLIDLLEGWLAQYDEAVQALGLTTPASCVAAAVDAPTLPASAATVQALQVPVWVEVALLMLTCLASTKPKLVSMPAGASRQQRTTVEATVGVEPSQTVAVGDVVTMAGMDDAMTDLTGSAPPAAPAAGAETPAPAPGVARDGAAPGSAPPAPARARPAMAAATPEPAPTANPNAALASATAGTPSADNASTEAAAAAAAGGVDAAMAAAKAVWYPTGLISNAQAHRCLAASIGLLRQLHAHAALWGPSLKMLLLAPSDAAASTPSPAAVTQAALHLLVRVTRRHSVALRVLHNGGAQLLLSLPRACLLPNFARTEPAIVSVLLNVLEDPATLEAWMEAEIRDFFAARARSGTEGRGYGLYGGGRMGAVQAGTFLSSLSRVMSREPTIFVEAVARLCQMEGPGVIRLRKPKVQNPSPAAAVAAAATTAPATATKAAAAGTAPGSTTVAGPSATPAAAGSSSTPLAPATGSKATPGGPSSEPIAPAAAAKTPAPKTCKKTHILGSFSEVVNSLIAVILAGAKEQQRQVTEAAAAAEAAAVTAAAVAADAEAGKKVLAAAATGPSDMELDAGAGAAVQRDQGGSGAGAPAAEGASSAAGVAPAVGSSLDGLSEQLALLSPALLSQVTALKALSEFCLLHGATVTLLLKKDTELWAKEHPPIFTPAPQTAKKAGTHRTPHATTATPTPATPGPSSSSAAAAAGAAAVAGPSGEPAVAQHRAGALLKCLLHRHLMCSDVALMPSVAERASHLLQAVCVRSCEGRKRVINEIVATLLLGSATQTSQRGTAPASPFEFSAEEVALALAPVEGAVGATRGAFEAKPGCAHPAKVRIFVALLATLAQPVPGASLSDPRQASCPPPVQQLVNEMVRTMRELGTAKALSAALRLVLPDHPLSGATAAAVLKPLEVLTRNMAHWAGNAAKPGGAGSSAVEPEAGTGDGATGQPLAAAGGRAEVAGPSTDAGMPAQASPTGAAAARAASAAAALAQRRGQAGQGRGQSGRANMNQMLEEMDAEMDMAMEGIEGDSGDIGSDDMDDDDDDDDDMDEGEDEDDDGGPDGLDGDSDDVQDALALQMPDGQVVHVMPGGSDGDGDDADMSDSDDDAPAGGSHGEEEEDGDVGDIRSSGEGDDDLSDSDEEDEDEGHPEHGDGDDDDHGMIRAGEHVDEDREAEEDEHEEEMEEVQHGRAIVAQLGEMADMLGGMVNLGRDEMRGVGMGVGDHIEMEDEEEEEEDEDEDGGSGDEFEDHGDGDGGGGGFEAEHDELMDGAANGAGFGGAGGFARMTRRGGAGAGGLAALLADTGGGMGGIDIRMMADDGVGEGTGMQQILRMLQDTVGRRGVAIARPGGGAIGRGGGRLMMPMDGGSTSDQATLLALASSNLVAQQHRMLERPTQANAGLAAAGGSAAVGAAAGGIGGRISMEALMASIGGQHRSQMMGVPLPPTGFSRSNPALVGLYSGGGATGVRVQGPPDSFPSIFAPQSAGGLGYRGGFRGMSMAGGTMATGGPAPISQFGGGGGGGVSRAGAGELFHRLIASGGRDPGSWGMPGYEAPTLANNGGDDVQFDARQLENQVVSMLRELDPAPAPPARSAAATIAAAEEALARAGGAAGPAAADAAARTPAAAGMAAAAEARGDVPGAPQTQQQDLALEFASALQAALRATTSSLSAGSPAGSGLHTPAVGARAPRNGTATADLSSLAGVLSAFAAEPSPATSAPPQPADVAPPAPSQAAEAGAVAAVPAAEVPAAAAAGEATPMDTDEPAAATAAAPAVAPEATAATTMNDSLRRAAATVGIDLAFLEALPDELRAEVLAMHGYQPPAAVPPPPLVLPVPAATPAPTAPAADAAAAGEGAAVPMQADGAVAAGGTGSAASAAAAPAPAPAPAAAPDAAVAAAASAPPPPEEMEEEGLDPEFLAALPREIQEELMQQQNTERRRRLRQREAAAASAAPAAASRSGAPVAGAVAANAAAAPTEMDLATLLATFPPDVREEVLLTSEESLLRTLPPALLAEANALRSRYRNAFRQQQLQDGGPAGAGGNPAVAGIAAEAHAAAAALNRGANRPPHDRSMLLGLNAAHPGIGNRRQPAGFPPLRSFLRTNGTAAAVGRTGAVASVAPAPLVGKAAEDAAIARESPSLLEDEDLLALVQLLRLPSEPHRSTPYQKVLLNLCCHTHSRRRIVRMLMAMVRASWESYQAAAAADAKASMEASTSEAVTGMAAAAAVVEPEATSLADALGRQGGAESAPAAGGDAAASEGDASTRRLTGGGAAELSAPLLQRRALTMVTHLARQSLSVARMLVVLRVPESMERAVDQTSPDAKVDDPRQPCVLEVLLQLLASAPAAAESGHHRAGGSSAVEPTLQLLETVLRVAVLQIDRLTHEGAAAVVEAGEARAKAAEAAAAAAKAQREAATDTGTPAADAATAVPKAAPEAAGAADVQMAEAGPFQGPAECTPAAAPPPAAAPAEASGSGAGPSSSSPFLSTEAGPSTEPTEPVTAAVALAAVAAAAPFKAAAEEISSVLTSLPDPLVKQLATLLGSPSLSESNYSRAGNALKHLVDASPRHLPLLLEELSGCLVRLAGTAAELLQQASAASSGSVLDTTGPSLLSVSETGGTVLRIFHLLQGLSRTPRGARHAPPNATARQLAMVRAEALMEVEMTGGSQVTAADVADMLAGRTPDRIANATAGATPGAAASATVSSAVKSLVASVGSPLQLMWSGLSSTIAEIEQRMTAAPHAAPSGSGAAAAAAAAAAAGSASAAKVLPPGALQVLPLVEAFFVMCSLEDALPPPPPATISVVGASASVASTSSDLGPGLSSDISAITARVMASAGDSASMYLDPASPGMAAAAVPQATDEKHAMFLRFVERHSRLLNAYVRRTPALLEGSLAPLMRVHRLIDFDNKRLWFRSKIRRQDSERPYGSLRINIRREHVFEDTFHQLRSRTPEEMRVKLSVQFTGEEGIDAGGVSREWYQVMAREIFDPNLALFIPVPEGGTTFQPNPNSVIQSDRGINHLDYFKFVGRIVGKALHDGQLIDAYFTRSFYKHMLGMPLTYEDIEGVDPEYYKNLIWMLANDITDVLDLTFAAESDFFGRKEVVELVPGGKDIRVTEANKREYVNLIARHRMTTSIKAQISAFLEGFWQLVPRDHITIFNDHELELLISGLPEVDVGDLRANTEYTGYSAAAPVVRWFWEIVGDMTAEDQALLLQFVTGTSKVPLDGFRALQGIGGPQKFQIHKAYGPTDRLPSAHTCFNQIDLPEYESKEQLMSKLMVALKQGASGFGFA